MIKAKSSAAEKELSHTAAKLSDKLNELTKETAAGTATNLELTHKLHDLTKEVSNLKNLEFMKVFKHPVKFMWFSFLKGLMVGFGSVLGASVLVAIFIYILAQIRLVPFVGDFVQDIIDQVKQEQVEAPENETPKSEAPKNGAPLNPTVDPR